MKKGPVLLATVSALIGTPGAFAEQPYELDPSVITATGMRESLLTSPAACHRRLCPSGSRARAVSGPCC